ncbi:MAG: hypothetical protein KDB80_17275 [Planctomycetes bacterium]|nr:hypothetical protein [Planctomycetota bacterium]
MISNRLISTVLSAVALSATLSAQSPTRILALTENIPQLSQIDINTCTEVPCNPPLGAAVAPWAGGTAHDPRDRMTWISDGLVLMKVDPRGGCTPICTPFTPPFVTPGVEITGLAVNEELQRLYISYSDNRIATFSAVGCALTYVSDCVVPVPPNHIIAGLATEDTTQEIYYASSAWLGPSSAPFSLLYRASQFSPCVPLCTPFQIPDCTSGAFFRLVTGLGFDSCTRELHVTDGWQITSVTNLWTCAPFITQCCPQVITSGDTMTGLCVLPSTEVPFGNMCFGGTSAVCPGMRHVLRGDPTIGNLGFALDLINAPGGSIAYLFLGLGPCSSFAGTTFSGLICANLYPTSFIQAVFVPGTGCSGNVSIPFPLPNIPFFCGITLSSQFIGQIPAAWSGSYVSNCLSWTITGN